MAAAYLSMVLGVAVLSAVLAWRAPSGDPNRRRLVAVAVLTGLVGASQVFLTDKTSPFSVAVRVPISLAAMAWVLLRVVRKKGQVQSQPPK